MLLGGGVQLAQHRQHLLADPHSPESGIDVRGVVAERQLRGARDLPGLGAGQGQQRAYHAPAPRRQPEQRPPARRDGQPVDQRLGQIGAGVPGGDPVCVGRGAQALGFGVAGLAGRRLDVAFGQRDPLHRQLNAEQVAERRAGGLVLVGVGAQAVVDVQPAHPLGPVKPCAQAGGETGRVGAAGEQRHAVRLRLDQPAAADRLGQLVGWQLHQREIPVRPWLPWRPWWSR